jgi:hypothetical protein
MKQVLSLFLMLVVSHYCGCYSPDMIFCHQRSEHFQRPDMTTSSQTRSECFQMAALGKHFPRPATDSTMMDPINPA